MKFKVNDRDFKIIVRILKLLILTNKKFLQKINILLIE